MRFQKHVYYDYGVLTLSCLLAATFIKSVDLQPTRLDVDQRAGQVTNKLAMGGLTVFLPPYPGKHAKDTSLGVNGGKNATPNASIANSDQGRIGMSCLGHNTRLVE